MILVRAMADTLYFLLREPEESAAATTLLDAYPGRRIDVVQKRDGLVLVRVTGGDEGTEGKAREAAPGPGFAIVGLKLPPRREKAAATA